MRGHPKACIESESEDDMYVVAGEPGVIQRRAYNSYDSRARVKLNTILTLVQIVTLRHGEFANGIELKKTYGKDIANTMYLQN